MKDMMQVKDKDVTISSKRTAEYEWLQRSLTQRGDTILRVGTGYCKKTKKAFSFSRASIPTVNLKRYCDRT